jgi:diguanylate cyclase (GGDEF)-like protein
LRSWHRSVMDGGEVVLCDLEQVLGGVLGADACESVRKTLGVTRVAVAPLVMEGESFGICVFVFAGEQADVELLELVAGHCTLALKGLATGEEATRFGGVDQVTWAHGRAYFLETLDAELARAKRFGRSVGLIILDIDDFGEFNASFGHTMGDRLLRALAMALAAPLVPPEFVARYGSDEFVILLPESSRAETLQDSRRIVRGLQGLSVFEDDAQAPGLSVSLAVVTFPEDGSSRDELLAAAEHELSRAKESRRAEMLRGEAAG